MLAEFSSTLLQKVEPRLSAQDVAVALDGLGPIAYGIHVYHGMIAAAAERAGREKVGRSEPAAAVFRRVSWPIPSLDGPAPRVYFALAGQPRRLSPQGLQ